MSEIIPKDYDCCHCSTLIFTETDHFLNDSILIERALDGDQSAYRDLYDHHVDYLFRFLMQFSQDRQIVADWVQQSFIKAFVKLDKFKGKSQFRTWLFSIGINEMRSAKRKQKHHEKIEIGENQLNLVEPERDLDSWLSVRTAIQKLDDIKDWFFYYMRLKDIPTGKLPKC